jgi:hypothetical protein
MLDTVRPLTDLDRGADTGKKERTRLMSGFPPKRIRPTPVSADSDHVSRNDQIICIRGYGRRTERP